MTQKVYSPLLSLNGKFFSVHPPAWIWSGHKFCLIHFYGGLFLGKELYDLSRMVVSGWVIICFASNGLMDSTLEQA